jgi:hypothetical protein
MTIEETIKETDRMIAESKETLHNMKIIGILGRLKNEIGERMNFSNPCSACTEYEYSERSGAEKAFEECILLINDEIEKLK